MKIKVIIKNSNEKCFITEIEQDLKSLQNAVGGYIEAPYVPVLTENGITMFINEEGKLLNLKPSIAIMSNGEFIDVIAGSAVFTSSDEKGNTIGLNNEQIEIVKKFLNSNKKCITLDGIILDLIDI